MIFVTVGSSTIPFDRLLRAVDAAAIDEHLVVQHGTSAIRPPSADCVEFLDYDEFVEHIGAARVIVTHAGVGSIMTTLAERKRPVVVPRQARYGEAVDDHQLVFARRCAELGLVTALEDADRLAATIVDYVADGPEFGSSPSPIEIELRSHIERRIGPPRTSLAMAGGGG
jgi:beta-1,4-N-acetylglucosaminyltransferase